MPVRTKLWEAGDQVAYFLVREFLYGTDAHNRRYLVERTCCGLVHATSHRVLREHLKRGDTECERCRPLEVSRALPPLHHYLPASEEPEPSIRYVAWPKPPSISARVVWGDCRG